jgi:hypothetical protein
MIDEENLLFNDDHVQEQTKDAFYMYMKHYGIDFSDVDPISKLPVYLIKVMKNEPVEYNKFNNVLYRLNKDNKINITDAITYLVDDWVDPQVLLKCLDEMNYYTLTVNLKSKYQSLNKTDSSMDDFLI